MSTPVSAKPTIEELLQLSDFGRLNPERARELSRGSSRNEPVQRPTPPPETKRGRRHHQRSVEVR